jgi:hypothetical protein
LNNHTDKSVVQAPPTTTSKNNARNPATNKHWKHRIGTPHRKMSGARTTKNNFKNIARNPPTKTHWKIALTTTPDNEWCKHHQKQPQTHCPKSTNKNTLNNRIEQPHREMSGASTTKHNFKNTARNPPTTTIRKIKLTSHTEK